jgi:hypothetical protein
MGSGCLKRQIEQEKAGAGISKDHLQKLKIPYLFVQFVPGFKKHAKYWLDFVLKSFVSLYGFPDRRVIVQELCVTI